MTELTARHHALLFAFISRALVQRLGPDDGEKLIRKAVRVYGRQRGRRMGLRAQRNGHPLTFDNYLVYGEWAVPAETMAYALVEKRPHAVMHVFKCPWHTAWAETNLMEFGRYFCREIDTALVCGFNPDLDIRVNATQSNGDQYCEFVFKRADLTLIKMAGLKFKKSVRPGKTAVMPWNYHCAHLYKTLKQVFEADAKSPADPVMEKALDDFSLAFSQKEAQAFLSLQHMDFDRLPNIEP